MATKLRESKLENSTKALLNNHQEVAQNVRKISEYMVEQLAKARGDEKKFLELAPKFDRVSLTLQRLCSIICNILPMEEKILNKRIELLPEANEEQKLTPRDFQMVILVAKEYGLLKEGSDEKLHEVLKKLYEEEQYEQEENNQKGKT